MTDATPKAAHFMLDLETLSLRADAAVISIGVWSFHITNAQTAPSLDRAFYCVLSSADQRLRHVDDKTVEWWAGQSAEARIAYDGYHRNGIAATREVATRTRLQDLTDFFETYKSAGYEIVVWGNGAKFDNGILSSLFESFDMRIPWAYKGDACYRTILGMFGHLVEKVEDPSLVEHNALDDARYQSNLLLKMVTPKQLDQMGVNLFTKKS